MTTTDLRTARDILTQHGWTQDAFARTSEGIACASTAHYAEMFCALGALHRAIGIGHDDGDNTAYTAFQAAVSALANALPSAPATEEPEERIAEFNDAPLTQRHDVLALFTRAIKLAEEMR